MNRLHVDTAQKTPTYLGIIIVARVYHLFGKRTQRQCSVGGTDSRTHGGRGILSLSHAQEPAKNLA
jgi:hypothetical protein